MQPDELMRFTTAMGWKLEAGCGWFRRSNDIGDVVILPDPADLPGQFAFVAEVLVAVKATHPRIWRTDAGGWFVGMDERYHHDAPTPAEAAIRAVLSAEGGDGAE